MSRIPTPASIEDAPAKRPVPCWKTSKRRSVQCPTCSASSATARRRLKVISASTAHSPRAPCRRQPASASPSPSPRSTAAAIASRRIPTLAKTSPSWTTPRSPQTGPARQTDPEADAAVRFAVSIVRNRGQVGAGGSRRGQVRRVHRWRDRRDCCSRRAQHVDQLRQRGARYRSRLSRGDQQTPHDDQRGPGAWLGPSF